MADKMNLVSIIVPVYNVESYLHPCLDSIIHQSYKNIEIILVNDGSTDKSGVICDEYSKIDARIRVIHKANEGVSQARNDGLKSAHGEYICFIDSDDVADLNLISKLCSAADQYDADITICGIDQIRNCCEVVNKCSEVQRELVEDKNLLYERFFSNPSYKEVLYGPYNKLIKKSLAKGVGFDARFKIGEDLLFSFSCLEKAERIYTMPDALYHYIKREGSAMTSPFSMKRYDYILVADILLGRCQLAHKNIYEAAMLWTWVHKLNFCISLIKHSKILSSNTKVFTKELAFLKQNYSFVKNKLSVKEQTKYCFLKLLQLLGMP